MRNSVIVNGVYSKLKDMILSSRLKPGHKLSDRDLAAELKVSRTPVRHALSRLEQDGLVENRVGKGYFVTELDASQVADLYALREVLEAHAIRLAAERATSPDLNELAGILALLEKYRDDPSMRGEEIRVGLRVHEIIARASGDAFLHETLVRLLNRMYSFIWMETLNEDPEAAELTRREHTALVALTREGRADEGEALVRRHIQTSKQHMVKILEAREAFYQHSDPRAVLAERSSATEEIPVKALMPETDVPGPAASSLD